MPVAGKDGKTCNLTVTVALFECLFHDVGSEVGDPELRVLSVQLVSRGLAESRATGTTWWRTCGLLRVRTVRLPDTTVPLI